MIVSAARLRQYLNVKRNFRTVPSNHILTLLTIVFLPGIVLGQRNNIDSTDNSIDSIVTVFNDQNHKLTLHVFAPESYEAKKCNATLTLTRYFKNEVSKVFVDSLYCMHPWIAFKDFNSDGVRDILVFNTTSARSNWTHYLYLVDEQNHKLSLVKGFEKLHNPELDTTTNIIISTALYEKMYYSFYRVSKNGKLLNLGHSFESDLGDPKHKLERAIRQIKKKSW